MSEESLKEKAKIFGEQPQGEEYFKRELEIYGKTVVANSGINEEREKELAKYTEAITNYKETVENLKKVKREGSSWFGRLFNREKRAEKACEEAAKVYVEARKNFYKGFIIEDENADLIRECKRKEQTNYVEMFMDSSHNRHNPRGHFIETEPLPIQEDKPSLWQRTKSFFTKTIPNLFKNIFGGTDNNTVKPSKDDHKQTFENVTNMTKGEQKKLNEERAQEIKNGIEAKTQGNNLGQNQRTYQ